MRFGLTILREHRLDFADPLGLRGLGQVSYVGIVSQQQQPETGRRPPRFSAFLSTGAVLGLLVGLLFSAIAPADARYDAAVTWGFLGLICAGLGLLLGGLVAVLIDRRS